MRNILHSATTIAALALAGCMTPVAVPNDDEWTESESTSDEYVWSAGDVMVVARAASVDRMSGRVESTSSAPQRFRITTSDLAPYPRFHWFGEVSGGPPTYSERWTRRIELGGWWDLPAASGEEPATLEFQLAPTHGTAIGFAYQITFSSPSGTSTCPFHFNVSEKEKTWWKVTKALGTVVGYILVAALMVAVVVASALGGSGNSDFGSFGC